jgi:hypothetical protein
MNAFIYTCITGGGIVLYLGVGCGNLYIIAVGVVTLAIGTSTLGVVENFGK